MDVPFTVVLCIYTVIVSKCHIQLFTGFLLSMLPLCGIDEKKPGLIDIVVYINYIRLWVVVIWCIWAHALGIYCDFACTTNVYTLFVMASVNGCSYLDYIFIYYVHTTIVYCRLVQFIRLFILFNFECINYTL